MNNTGLFAEKKITAIAFSPDGRQCAVAFKYDNSINVYEVPSEIFVVDKWVLRSTIRDQTQYICALDWASSGKLLSCSHDRSAVVWRPEANNTWTKEMVNCYNKLSITDGVWSPNGKKIAIGSSCKKTHICFFNQSEDFWACKLVKVREEMEFKSTITTVQFHQSGNIVAIGSSDYSVKLITCSLSTDIDGSHADDTSYKGPFDNIKTFGVVLMVLEDLNGWANALFFNPNGKEIAVLPHNNSYYVETLPEGSQTSTPAYIQWKGLPFTSGAFIDKDTFVAGGYDKRVALFKRQGTSFVFVKFLEDPLISSLQVEKKKSLVSGMTSMFERQGVKKLQEKGTVGLQEGTTHHDNTIKVLLRGNQVCSWDSNGKIHFWQV